MSKRLPAISGKKIILVLGRAGFVLVRTSGSHARFVHPHNARRATTVPLHAGKDLPRGTVRAIIEQAGLTTEEFLSLLRKKP